MKQTLTFEFRVIDESAKDYTQARVIDVIDTSYNVTALEAYEIMRNRVHDFDNDSKLLAMIDAMQYSVEYDDADIFVFVFLFDKREALKCVEMLNISRNDEAISLFNDVDNNDVFSTLTALTATFEHDSDIYCACRDMMFRDFFYDDKMRMMIIDI